MSSPIADLTYRSYDGPLQAPRTRWWPIAKMSMRLAIKKKGFWVTVALSGYYFMIFMAVLYFVTSISGASGSAAPVTSTFFDKLVWHDQFLTAFGFSQLFLLIIALMIGSTSIASDNLANALLIYLARPITKLDYLVGKWLGVFIPISLTVIVPALVFYLYCGMAYASYGFFSDHWLLLKIVFIGAAAGGLHASLSLGISSLFKQTGMSTAAYASVYFLSMFLSSIVGAIYQDPSHRSAVMRAVYYLSVEDIQIGMAKLIVGSDGSPTLFLKHEFVMPRPDMWAMLLVYFGVCIGGFLLAWSRIRAVEVIGS